MTSRLFATSTEVWDAPGDSVMQHMLIEPFLDPDTLDRVIRAFPGPTELPNWQNIEVQSPDGRLQSHRKLVHSETCNLASALQELIEELHGPLFIGALEATTGIAGLQPDPTLYGGGLHHYLPGAFLRVHEDANVHPQSGLHRRLNLILYLNDPWDDAWDGALELWSEDGRRIRSILPVANRCIVFASTPGAYHAISPVRCPPEHTRKSVMVRYYTEDRPAHEKRPPHRAQWI